MKKLLLTILPALLIACSSGTSGTAPATSDQFMYVVNRGDNALVCNIIESGQSVTNCIELLPMGINMADVSGITAHPTAPIAYITEAKKNKVYMCDIDLTNNGQLINCEETALFSELYRPAPVDLAIIPNLGVMAFIANDSLESSSIVTCNVNPDNYALGNCYTSMRENKESSVLSMSPTGTAVNPVNFQLIVSVFYGDPASCNINALTIHNCNKLNIDGYKFWATTDVTVSHNGKYAYFANYGARFVSICTIDQSSGDITSCQDSIDILNTGYKYGINVVTLSIDDTIAYVSNFDKGTISVCNINTTDGIFTSCNELPIQFTNPSAISIYQN